MLCSGDYVFRRKNDRIHFADDVSGHVGVIITVSDLACFGPMEYSVTDAFVLRKKDQRFGYI